MCKHSALLLLALLFGAVSVWAERDPFDVLLSARSLKCQFGPGSSGQWKNEKPSIEAARFDVTLHFDAIDLKAGKARFIGNQGASDVTALTTETGITFIERTGFGNLVFTTVFAETNAAGDMFYAVTSRHMNLLAGGPLPSQYLGTCTVWQ
jgi:hypothetical protein